MTNYLPRINTTLNDLGLKIAPPPSGPKVTLLGITSNTGIPVYEPYTINSVEKALNTFWFSGVTGWNSGGAFPGELSRAIEEASVAGAQNIEVMVIGHYSGQSLLNYLNPTAEPTGRFSDLSGAYDILRNRELDVVVPIGAYLDHGPTTVANRNFGKQLADFCYQATSENNSCVGVIATQPILEWAATRASGLFDDTTLSGELTTLLGVSFATMTGQSYSLTGDQISTLLTNTTFSTPSSRLTNDYVAYHAWPERSAKCVSSVNDSANYHAYYLSWLSGAADQNGAILDEVSEATASAVNTAYFTQWQAVDSDGTAALDSRGVKIDAGGFINVFTAPIICLGTQTKTLALALGAAPSKTSYNAAGAAPYAGLINTLAPQSATTNKSVPGVNSLKLLSSRQANELTGTRHVTMLSRTRGLVVSRGLTGAHNVTKYVRSDYVNLSTMRIVQAAVDLIRSVSDKYIGEPNNAPQINALDAEIDQVLLSMKGQGAINSYDFAISSTPDQRVLGELDINLTLVPAFEIVTINLVVSLSKE